MSEHDVSFQKNLEKQIFVLVGLLLLALPIVSYLQSLGIGTPPRLRAGVMPNVWLYGPTVFMAAIPAFLATFPKLRYVVILAALGVLSDLALADFSNMPDWVALKVRAVGTCLGSFFYIGLIVQLAKNWNSPSRRKTLALVLLAAFPLCYVKMTTFVQRLIAEGSPWVYDMYAYACERAAYGFSPGVSVGRLINLDIAASYFVWAVYLHILLWMISSVILSYLYPAKCYLHPLVAFVTVTAIGMTWYSFLPMVGLDAFLGQAFRASGPQPVLSIAPQLIEMPNFHTRNCFPSLHTSWVLLSFLLVARMKPSVVWSGVVVVVATVCGALGKGHYVIDLVFALPTVILVLGLSARHLPFNHPARWLSVGGGLLSLILFTVSFRSHPEWHLIHAWTQVAMIPFFLLALLGVDQWLFRGYSALAVNDLPSGDSQEH